MDLKLQHKILGKIHESSTEEGFNKNESGNDWWLSNTADLSLDLDVPEWEAANQIKVFVKNGVLAMGVHKISGDAAYKIKDPSRFGFV